MSRESSNDSAEPSHSPEYPWWEPYLFTGGVLLAFLISLAAFGYVAKIPYVEPTLFALSTVTSAVAAFRRPSSNPAVIGKVLLTTFFTLASIAYFSKSERLLGLGFAGMAMVWLCLSIHAQLVRRRARRERLAKLDRAVETLDRALPNGQKSIRSSANGGKTPK